MNTSRELILAALTSSFFAVVILCCTSSQNHTDTEYKEEVNEWHDRRISNLEGPGRLVKTGRFFIILGDKTNGLSTYGGGRYIYIPTLDEDNITYIDFNKSYNPPCVFTNFATCPLPPAQNRLPITITAGERMYKGAQTY